MAKSMLCRCIALICSKLVELSCLFRILCYSDLILVWMTKILLRHCIALIRGKIVELSCSFQIFFYSDSILVWIAKIVLCRCFSLILCNRVKTSFYSLKDWLFGTRSLLIGPVLSEQVIFEIQVDASISRMPEIFPLWSGLYLVHWLAQYFSTSFSNRFHPSAHYAHCSTRSR